MGTHLYTESRYTAVHFSLANRLLSNLLRARHYGSKENTAEGQHVDPAARESGFESPLGVILSQ